LSPSDPAEVVRLRFAAGAAQESEARSGEPYMIHPLLVTRQLADMHMDMVPGTGLLHDVVEDTSATSRRSARIRRRSGALRGRRHQAEQAEPGVARGAPGRERPQDAARHGQRHPRDPGEAGRPAAQHAHAGPSAARAAGAHRPGDHRDLRAHRAPPGHGQNPRRAGGSGLPYLEPEASADAAQGVRSRPRVERSVPRRDQAHRRGALAREGIPAAWTAASSAPIRCSRS
jgi:hypothetical protein